MFITCLFIFMLIAILKSELSYCISFALSLVEKVTTGTQSFVSAILFTSEMKQFVEQVRIRSILQLIKSI